MQLSNRQVNKHEFVPIVVTKEKREKSKMSKKVSSSAKPNQIGPKLDIKLNWAPLMVKKDGVHALPVAVAFFTEVVWGLK